jgi:hypothetical protein
VRGGTVRPPFLKGQSLPHGLGVAYSRSLSKGLANFANRAYIANVCTRTQLSITPRPTDTRGCASR